MRTGLAFGCLQAAAGESQHLEALGLTCATQAPEPQLEAEHPVQSCLRVQQHEAAGATPPQ